jgi:hypothetical protein
MDPIRIKDEDFAQEVDTSLPHDLGFLLVFLVCLSLLACQLSLIPGKHSSQGQL